jgi:hypothetical protein
MPRHPRSCGACLECGITDSYGDSGTEVMSVLIAASTTIILNWGTSSCRLKISYTMKNTVFWDVMPHGSCKNWRLEECIASIIRVTRIGEIGTLTVTSNRRMLRIFRFLSLWWWRHYVPPKSRFLQKPHGTTSQKTEFFIVTAMKTSNLTFLHYIWFIFTKSELTGNETNWDHKKILIREQGLGRRWSYLCGSASGRGWGTNGFSQNNSNCLKCFWFLSVISLFFVVLIKIIWSKFDDDQPALVYYGLNPEI